MGTLNRRAQEKVSNVKKEMVNRNDFVQLESMSF